MCATSLILERMSLLPSFRSLSCQKLSHKSFLITPYFIRKEARPMCIGEMEEWKVEDMQMIFIISLMKQHGSPHLDQHGTRTHSPSLTHQRRCFCRRLGMLTNIDPLSSPLLTHVWARERARARRERRERKNKGLFSVINEDQRLTDEGYFIFLFSTLTSFSFNLTD